MNIVKLYLTFNNTSISLNAQTNLIKYIKIILINILCII